MLRAACNECLCGILWSWSFAEVVLSTSPHVRIMAFICSKPRVTWCKEKKHEWFIRLWDAEDSPQWVRNLTNTWTVLNDDYYGPDPSVTQEKTKVGYGKTVDKYLESFDKWSDKLRNKTRVEEAKPFATTIQSVEIRIEWVVVTLHLRERWNSTTMEPLWVFFEVGKFILILFNFQSLNYKNRDPR